MEFQGVHLGSRALAALGVAGTLARAAARARADTLRPVDPGTSPDPPGATSFRDTGGALTLTRRASWGAPGYTLTIAKQPFELTTTRDGQTVLATTGAGPTAAAARFVSGGTSYYATRVKSADWRHGMCTLALATSGGAYHIAYGITPKADRYAVRWDVSDPRTASSVGGDFALASAGHWYGQGIAVTE